MLLLGEAVELVGIGAGVAVRDALEAIVTIILLEAIVTIILLEVDCCVGAPDVVV